MNLQAADVEQLLEKDIPHRVRSALARTERLWHELRQMVDWMPQENTEKVARRCETDAIWEGRLSAMRWLIELVGITRDRNGVPIPKPRNNVTDLFLSDLPGGSLISQSSPEAQTIALFWKGSTQASSHPTFASGHPPVNEAEIKIALDLIIDHLQRTVYATAGKDLLKIALQA